MLAAGLIGTAVVVATGVRRFEVVGSSMAPTLVAGDRVVLARWARPRPGDVVVVRDPRVESRLVVKRVEAAAWGWVTVRGDNPAESTDSRAFGPLPATAVHGRVVYRYHPQDRAGPVRRRPRVP